MLKQGFPESWWAELRISGSTPKVVFVIGAWKHGFFLNRKRRKVCCGWGYQWLCRIFPGWGGSAEAGARLHFGPGKGCGTDEDWSALAGAMGAVRTSCSIVWGSLKWGSQRVLQVVGRFNRLFVVLVLLVVVEMSCINDFVHRLLRWGSEPIWDH